jgi:Bacteriophage tail sheath protein
MHVAKRIHSWAEFTRVYGQPRNPSLTACCIQQFYENGGGELLVIRIGSGILKTNRPVLKGLEVLQKESDAKILCIPQTHEFLDREAARIFRAAIQITERLDALYLLDPPQKQTKRATASSLQQWIARQRTIKHPNVAIYCPRVRVLPNANTSQGKLIPTSGTMAGVFARTDRLRGVWKAPAGVQAQLKKVEGLERQFTDQEINTLTPLGINSFRTLSATRILSWGARTTAVQGEWQYVPIRRLALFLKTSIERGTQWVVFEPNDEPLWAKIRHTIETFMMQQFQRGALAGAKPEQAFFVKCGRDTMTVPEQQAGIIKIIVGFAPLKPAEFVILNFQHQVLE